MAFHSKNMNYIFNVEYFDGLSFSVSDTKKLTSDSGNEDAIKRKNFDIEAFSFPASSMSEALKAGGLAEKMQSFSLYTIYPGLLMGTGMEHALPIEGEIQCGFTFDYVTGQPFLPGSSLKGLLRSYFPGDGKDKALSAEYGTYIRSILGVNEDFDLQKLKDDIFENNDVFLGGYPVVAEQDARLMKMEYLTPHKSKFKNPIPISIVKVQPGVKFDFCFLLSDYTCDGEVLISAEQKCKLFRQIILDMGAGAKTNTGFGQFSEKKMEQHASRKKAITPGSGKGSTGAGKGQQTKPSGGKQFSDGVKNAGNSNAGGTCRKCGKKVKINQKTGKPYPYCYECNNNR